MLTYLYRIYWYLRKVIADRDDMYISSAHLNEILQEKGKQ